jgi:hypothetical protein
LFASIGLRLNLQNKQVPQHAQCTLYNNLSIQKSQLFSFFEVTKPDTVENSTTLYIEEVIARNVTIMESVEDWSRDLENEKEREGIESKRL